MFCSKCGLPVEDGDRFCKNCGAPLQVSNGIGQQPPMSGHPQRVPASPTTPRRRGRGPVKQKDPYKDQIAQLRLQLKEMKLQLRQLNNQIRGTRSNYFELDSFVQRGPLNHIGRMVEGAQLFGPYQQKKQLQDQIMQLEYELLPLEKAQEQWKVQQQQIADMGGDQA